MTEKKKILKISIVGILLLVSIIGTAVWLIYPQELVPEHYAGVAVKYNTVEKVYESPDFVTIEDPFVQLELITTDFQDDKHAVVTMHNATLYSNLVWRIDPEKIGYVYKKYGGDEDHPVSENFGRKAIQNMYRILYPDKARWLFKKPEGSYKKSLIDTTLQMDLLQISAINDSEIANARLKIIDDLKKEGVAVEFLEIKTVPESQETSIDYEQENSNSRGIILFIGFVLIFTFGVLFANLLKKK